MITSDLQIKLTELQVKLVGLQTQLGHNFSSQDLLVRALTHKSFDNENQPESHGHNEVLEFLGDAVIDLGLGHLLMTHFPDDDEGGLSRKRASLVNEFTLSEVALELKLDEVVFLGRGEKTSGGSRKPRLLASTFEALVGALFLDSNFDVSARVIKGLFGDRISNHDWTLDFAQDYKTRLQEKVQSSHGLTPHYVMLSQSGPDHDKRFEVELRVGEEILALGHGSSKKSAEQAAARLALNESEKNKG